MKNKGLTFRIGISIFITVMLILLVAIFKNNVVLNRSYAYDAEGITNIAQFVDEGNNTDTSASFVLQDLDNKTLDILSDNKYKVFSTNDDITITLLDTKTNEELDYNNYTFNLSSDGVTVKVDGLSQGNKYDIKIQPVSSNKGYKPKYSEATVEIDYTSVLSASVKEIKDNDNNPIELSDNDRIVFLYTDINDKIKLRANKDIDIEYTYSLDELSEEELKGAHFTSYDKNNYLSVSTNGYLYAKAKYKNSSYSKISMLHITNIDKLAPVGTISSVTESNDHMSATVRFNIGDQAATREYGKSDIAKYAFNVLDSMEIDDNTWIDATSGNYSAEVFDNGTYYLHTLDKAGNKSVTEVTVDQITFVQPGYLVLILESSNNDLVGKYYNSLMKMKEDFDAHNLTNEDTVVAQIEGDINNQYMDVENVNLTLDLNGYILESKRTVPTFDIKNGASLKIVDNKYEIDDYINNPDEVVNGFENGEHYGTVKNHNTNAIVINNNSTLQLGEDNSPDLLHIEYPDHTSPNIIGKDRGIVNNGTFKYFDGVIVGNIAIEGTVNDTPYLYDPNVVLTEDNKNRMTLERVVNIEALIGKTRYTLLEDAIDAANNRVGTVDDQIEIDIIVNLEKEVEIVIPKNKNIVLDLNGNTFTNVIDKPVITNYGKTAIKTSIEGGQIVGHNSETIVNMDDAELTIESGTYSNDKYDTSIIHNYGGAKLTVNDGTLRHDQLSRNIINEGGIVDINGGYFVGQRGSWNYGTILILNRDSSSENIYSTETNIINNMLTQPNVNRGFEEDDDGGLSPVGLKIPDATSDMYYVVDLRNYDSTVEYEIDVEAEVNVRDGDYFYTYFRTDDSYQWYNNTSNRSNYVTGNQGTQTYKTVLQGGNYYTFHIGFWTQRNSSEYPDTQKVSVKNITLKERRHNIGRVNINGGQFEDQWTGYCYYNESYSNQSFINGGDFNCIYSAVTVNGDINITGGNLNREVLNERKRTVNISGGYIGQLTNSNGIVNMSNGTVNNIYVGYAGAYISGYGTQEQDASLYITGGKVTGRLQNRGILDIKGGTIEGYIDNYNANTLKIKNATFDRKDSSWDPRNAIYSINMEVADSELQIDNCNFVTEIPTTTDYNRIPTYIAIWNKNTSSVGIDHSNFNIVGKKGYGTPNNNNTYNMIYAIYLASDSETYIDNTSINVSTEDTNRMYAYAYYNKGKGNLYIGKNDSNYEEDRNTLSSNYHAIYNPQSNIYFYDGVIKGNTRATDDVIYKNETGYYVYRYDNDGIDTIKQVNDGLGSVYNVEQDRTYNSLGEALDNAGNQATLRFLNKYTYATLQETNEIKANQDITLDLNGNQVYFGKGLINSGKLKITNSVEEIPVLTSHKIINNNDMTIEAGQWLLELDDYQGIMNNGSLTLKGAVIQTTEMRRGESIIENNNELFVQSGTKLTSGAYASSHIIKNNYSGSVYISGGELSAPSGVTSENTKFDGKVIYNDGGYVEINGGTITGFSEVSDYRGAGALIANKDHIPDGTIQGAERNGGFYSSNTGRSIIPIDLSDYSGNVTIEIMYDGGWGTAISLLETVDTSTYYSSMPNSIINHGDFKWRETVTTSAQGGKKYYLHFVSGYDRSTTILDLKIKQGSNVKELLTHGRLVFNNGTIIDSGRGEAIATANAYTEMNGGTIKSADDVGVTGVGVGNLRNASFKMTGGLIHNRAEATQFNYLSYGKFVNGTITHHLYGAANTSAINAEQGKIDIDDITVDFLFEGFNGAGWDNCGIRLANDSTLDMRGGSITITGGADRLSGIGIRGTNTANVSNATITIDSASTSDGIHQSNRGAKSVVSLDNVTINVGKSGTTNRTTAAYLDGINELYVKDSVLKGIGNNSYGVYAQGSSGTKVEFSNKDTDDDGFVSQTTPLIQGTKAGMYRDAGTFNYYDGIIKGTNQIIGGITAKPDGYELLYGNDGTLPTVVLDKLDLIQNTDTGEKYSKMKSAFDACPENDTCHLKQLERAQLPTKVTIPSNKTIIYDLNEKQVSTSEEMYFENKGTLTVKNGTLSLEAVTNEDPIIYNEGTLNIETGTTLTLGLSSAAKLIHNVNPGIVNVNAGSLVATTGAAGNDCDGRAIYNEGGYVEINGGTITGQACAPIANKIKLPEGYNNPGYDWSDGSTFSNDWYTTIPIDLSNYTGDVNINIDYDANYANGKFYIDENEDAPLNGEEPIKTNTEATFEGNIQKVAVGGKKYYLHFIGSALMVNTLDVSQGSNKEEIIKKGVIVINNGTIQYENYDDRGRLINNYDSYLNITGGVFTNNAIGIYSHRDGLVNVTGGQFNSLGTALYFMGYSNGNITGGIINNPQGGGNGIIVEEGYVDVKDMTINIGGTISVQKSSRASFDNITLNQTGSSNQYIAFSTYLASSELTLKNFTIKGECTSARNPSNVIGVYINEGGKLSLENMTIDVTAKGGVGSSIGISSNGGNNGAEQNISIKNSTIEAKSQIANNTAGYGSYGIYNPFATSANIIISNDDDTVSQTKSRIYGDDYGIYVDTVTANDSTMKFMDGIIEGKKESYNAGFTTIPEGYQVKYGTNGDIKYAILDHYNIIKNTDTDEEYDNIQSAVNNCVDNTLCHLQQVNDINTLQTTTIPDKKNIEWDGNGKKLMIVNDKNITNYGTIKFINGTVTAATNKRGINLIENYNKLYFDTGAKVELDGKSDVRLVYNHENSKVIINAGTFNVGAARAFTYLATETRLIYNEGGYVEINGGTINISHLSAIYNVPALPEGVVQTGWEPDHGVPYSYYGGVITIPVDLSEFEGTVNLDVKINNEGGSAKTSYVAITESSTFPTGSFEKIWESNQDLFNQRVTVQLQGGKKYYLHGSSQGDYNNRSTLFVSTITARQGATVKEIINKAELVVNGGTLNDKCGNSLINNYNSNVTINGGTLMSETNNGTGIKNHRGSEVTINNGTFNQFVNAIYQDSYGETTINNGTFEAYNGGYIVNSNAGEVDVNNITANYSNGFYLEYGSTLDLGGGTINIDGKGATAYGINAFRNPRIYVDGNVVLNVTSTGSSYGIYSNTYNNNYTQRITIGNNDGIVSQEYPHVTAGTTAFYIDNNNSIVKYYDGKFTSAGEGIHGSVDNIPVGYQISTHGDDTYLELKSTIENTFEYNGVYYSNINIPIQTISNLSNKVGTIKVWNDVDLDYKITIPSGVDLTIALEGHQIRFDDSEEPGIINNGTLKVIDGIGDEVDSYTDSSIVNLSGVVIQNNGSITVGASGNPNSQSPRIKGTTAITGNSATLLSGKIESTEGGIIQTVGAALANLFTIKVEPSYSYKTSTYQVNKLSDDIVLATSPTFRSVESLESWTNQDISLGMTSHNVGVLSLVTDRDENQTKQIEYTIEVYKNGQLDEFYTYRKVIDVQYLDDDTLDVDLDWFDDVEKKFKEYYLTRMTINGNETKVIPEIVKDGTTFKLYYGQTKGDEIELVNPKTGRKSYKLTFFIVLILSLTLIGIMIGSNIRKKMLEA